jgi:streptogramin lyase
VVRQAHLIPVVGAFLIAVVVVGCGSGPGNIDERDGEGGSAATNEETTAPKGDGSAAGTAQEPVGFDEEVVSPLGQANLPEGFGEGSLWATGFAPSGGCDDVKDVGEAACGGGDPPKTLLKRVDPRTGEVVAEIPLACVGAEFGPQVAFGAGSVWVSSGISGGSPRWGRSPCDVVLRVDPRTKRVVSRIPVDSPTDVAFGHGSVWATSAGYGTLSRIDPKTDEVVAKIDVDRGAGDIAVDKSSGAVWVAGVSLNYDKPENNKLSRVDPATNRVVAEIPIRAGVRLCKYHSPGCLGAGADKVAVGEGAVWAQSIDGKLLKVDPETNEVAGMVSVGAFSPQLVVYGGGVWTLVQAEGFRLVRVDPSTMHVVASEEFRPFYSIAPGGLAAGGGYVWFSSGEGLARVSP